MSQGKITVEMEWDGTKFTVGVRDATNALNRLEKSTAETAKSVASLDRHFKSVGRTIHDFTMTASMAHGAISNLHTITTRWMLGIVNTNAEIERLTFMLKGMSSAASSTEKWKEAEGNVAWLREFAKNAPFDLEDLSKSFVRFKSVGLDPTAGGFKALVDSVAAFGGNNDVLQRASIAIQQMAGKGVISMEELRQQLGEAVPRAIELMARSMNMTVAQLVSAISKGTVEAKGALDRMLKEMERTFGGSAENMMHTWTGMVSRLGTEWTTFQLQVGGKEGGFFQEAKNQLSDLISLLGSPNAKVFANDLGQGLISVVQGARSTVETLWSLRDTIKMVGEAMLFYFAVSKIQTIFGGFSGAVATASTQLSALGTAFMRTGGAVMSFGTAATAGLTGVQAVAYTAGTAVRTLGAAFNMILGPIGMVLGAAYLLADAFDLFGNKAKEAMKIIREGGGMVDQKMVDAATEGLKEQAEAIKELRLEINKMETAKKFWESKGVYSTGGNLEELKKELADLEISYAKTSQNIVGYREDLLNQEASKELRKFERLTQEKLEVFRGEYDQQMVALQDMLRKKDMTNKEFEEARINLVKYTNQRVREVYESEISYYQEQIPKATAGMAIALGNMVKGLRSKLVTHNAADEQQISLMDTPKPMNGDKTKPAAPDPYKSALDGLRAKAADAKAELAGLNGEVAKYEYMANSGKFGKVSEAQKKALIDAARETQSYVEKLKEKSKVDADAVSANQALTRSYEGLAEKFEAVKAAFVNSDVKRESDAYLRFAKQLDQNVAAISKADPTAGVAAAEQAAIKKREFQQIEMMDYARGLREKSAELRRSIMTDSDAKEAEYRENVARVHREFDVERLTGEERVKAEEIRNEYLLALAKKHKQDMEGPIGELLRKWKDTSAQMQEAGARWLDDFTDKLVDFAITGKATFADFAESVLRDILKMQMRAQMAQTLGGENGFAGIIGKFAGALFSGYMGSGGGGDAVNTSGRTDSTTSGQYAYSNMAHTGGIIGMSGLASKLVDMNAFNGASRFHGGGIIGKERLTSDEVPIITKKGEGVFTQEQMKALGGGGNQKIQINLINQTGQQTTAEHGQPRFDAEGMILDVVLRNVSRPGSFREGMKGAMSS